MGVSVRLAAAEDAEALSQMRWQSGGDSAVIGQTYAQFEERFGEFVRAAVGGEDWVVWVAERDGRIVGQLYLRVVDMVPRPGRAVRKWGCISAVYVVPEARGRRAASSLVARAVAWAREEALEYLLLSAEPGSERLYKRAGFRRGAGLLELELGG